MAGGWTKAVQSFTIALSLLWSISAVCQQSSDIPEVPPQFKLDMETAARLRPQLLAKSAAPAEAYVTGRLVFERLVTQAREQAQGKFAWQLRIVEDHDLNAYSSPDGTVYVESGLARLAGHSSGLWAAILSHEVAHILRRDWARRYLYQKKLESGGGGAMVLGDPGLPSISWENSEKASADFGQFSRQLELEADREGLMMMAHAGYHPDFVPALHHLLHANGVGSSNSRTIYAMHPCWEERDHDLNRAYIAASIEFAKHWPEWYASPGGNPPVVVFAEEPTVKKTDKKEWQIQIPMRCQNLAGAVEIVLRAGLGHGAPWDDVDPDGAGGSEVRQLTGCTSPKTTITFTLAEESVRPKAGERWTGVYVLDAWGAVLASADLPKMPR